MNIIKWAKAETSEFITWEKQEVNEVSTFLSPFLKNIKSELKRDLLIIAKNALPAVLAALGDNPFGNLALGLAAAEKAIFPALQKEGIVLFQTTLNIIYNGLVGYAQSVAPASPQPVDANGNIILAPSVIIPIPSAEISPIIPGN